MSKFYRSFRNAACAALTLVVGIGGLVAGTGPAAYRIEDLGTFGGPEECETGVFPTAAAATALNEAGHVSGWAEHSEWLLDPDTGEPLVYPDTGLAVCRVVLRAALWRHGEIIDLGVFEGATHPIPYDLNDHDQVVGAANADFGLHPFFWTEGEGMTDLLDQNGTANAINNFGEIVIVADEAYFRDAQGGLHPIRFPEAVSFPADAFAINDDGFVVGYEWRDSPTQQFHAFRYDSRADAIEDIHDPFYIQSFGYGLNEDGDTAVVMVAYTWHAFSSVSTRDGDLVVLPLGNMRYRGELRPDLLSGGADDINARGDVIGTDISVAHRGVMPWIAFDVFGEGPLEKIPLDNLLSPEDQADWEIFYAWGLNDSRQIAGYAAHHGVARAFLMTPDETTTSVYPSFRASIETEGSHDPAGATPAVFEGPSRIVEDARDLPPEFGPNRRLGSVHLLSAIKPPEVPETEQATPVTGRDDGSPRTAPRVPRRTDREPVGRDGTRPGSPREADTDRTTDPIQRNDG